MNLPRPNLLRQELTNIGVVYDVVFLVLIYGLAPSADQQVKTDTPAPASLGPTTSC